MQRQVPWKLEVFQAAICKVNVNTRLGKSDFQHVFAREE
jgi:hypothetical protein